MFDVNNMINRIKYKKNNYNLSFNVKAFVVRLWRNTDRPLLNYSSMLPSLKESYRDMSANQRENAFTSSFAILNIKITIQWEILCYYFVLPYPVCLEY